MTIRTSIYLAKSTVCKYIMAQDSLKYNQMQYLESLLKTSDCLSKEPN